MRPITILAHLNYVLYALIIAPTVSSLLDALLVVLAIILCQMSVLYMILNAMSIKMELGALDAKIHIILTALLIA